MKRTLIIAEAGVNHNGDMQLAKTLIDKAADSGADYVKFQTFKAEKLVSKTAKKAEYQIVNTANHTSSQFEMLKKLELNREAHQLLIDYCKTKNIQFLSTAFDTESIDLLSSLGITIYKVPSGEITNLPFLKKIGQLNNTVVLSTGMSDMKEIEDALTALVKAGTNKENITVLHCNTEYPTPMKDVNLNALSTLRDKFNIKIGYSDHTLGIEVPIAAVAMGAVLIEKHFTLDRDMEGPDHRASLVPEELKAMVNAIRNIEQALGDGIKQPSASEIKNKIIARKSIHLAENLIKGHTITEEDLIMIRPGNGISPMMMDRVIGKKLTKNFKVEHQLRWEDIELD